MIGGAPAIANELIKGRNTDRDYSKKFGNTLEIKSQEDVDVNLDGQGAKTFTQADTKRWHELSAGEDKVYIRSRVTQERKLFHFGFPSSGDTETVTIRPRFRPPGGEAVDAQTRRRTGILGGLAWNEIFKKGTG